MKEDKSAPETTRRIEPSEPARKPRSTRPAPRTEIDAGGDSQSGEIQRLLNDLLADEFVLYMRTLNFHWNVRGMQFHSLHLFFEELYKGGLQRIDDIAEKVRALGGFATATLGEYLKLTRIREQAGATPDPRAMISTLTADHETLIKHLREVFHTVQDKFDDPSTENFLCDLLETHEKTRWMLHTHLDRELG
jgi:starvation-inducible DNA-binding protein